MATDASPTRIAFCITDLDPGGAERALVQLVTRLDRSRFDPHVICLGRPGKLVEVLDASQIPVTCLGARRWWDVRLFWRLSRELKRIKPQLLQTFLFHANFAGRLTGWWSGVPHIVSGIRVAEKRRNLYLTLDRWTESLVDKHVCVSAAVLFFSLKTGRLSPGKVCVIANGVDYDQFANAVPLDLTRWSIHADDETWVTVGRLDLQKGPWELLAAVQKLSARHPKLKVLWAGEGPLREKMQQWINAHQLQDVVQLIGWQSDVPGLLRAARGFVLCSRWEGMPNVILEAMAAGLPVISTDVEGVSEVITDRETGFVVKQGEDYAERWEQLLSDRGAAVQMATAGQADVRDRFTWQAMAERYMDLYDEILKKKERNTNLR